MYTKTDSLKLFEFFFLPGNPCQSSDTKVLNDSDRSVLYEGATDKCDHNDLANGWNFWYRVSGEAGNALAAIDVPAENTCGTVARMYLAEDHPTPSDGTVTREVCVDRKRINCYRKFDIQVINCGTFYLYKLHQARKNCSPAPWRYCTNGEVGK